MSARKIAFGICALAFVLEVIVAFNTDDPPDAAILRRPFKPWTGNAFTAYVFIPWSKADTESERASTVELFEDGRPLGPAHTSFSDVAINGSGRFMFWGDNSVASMIVFSASDNSDPNTNGRVYRVFDPNAQDPYKNSRLSFQIPEP